MAKQTINPGVAPTGAGGDTFRSGSAKLQANDDELYKHLGAGDGSLTAAKTRTALGLGDAATRGIAETGSGLVEAQSVKKAFGARLPQVITGINYEEMTGGDYYFHLSSNTTAQNPPPFINASIYCEFSLNGGNQKFLRAVDYNTGNLAVKAKVGSNWSAWSKIYSQSNTTVDGNGFIKNASPIVKLFADKIELNDEAQLQEITFEKLGTGDYLIKGSSGFSQDGWYIETPKDANGNVLFSVIYTTLENGDISVKTYKKKFDFETVSIVADLDNPVDITENRWIDIRLQELPQPEIEIPESITPPEFQPTGLAQAVATVMESYHDPEQ